MKLTSIDKDFFNKIYIDSVFMYIGTNKIPINWDIGLYNQIISVLKDLKRYEPFILYLKDAYNVTDNEHLDNVKTAYVNKLNANSKKTIYAEVFRLYRRNNNEIEVYTVQKDNVLSYLTNTSESNFYSKILNYLQFNKYCNLICSKFNIKHPLSKTTATLKTEFKEAMQYNLIPEIDCFKVLSNKDEYCLAYYDLNSGNQYNATIAWDNFTCQIKDKEAVECFKAWVYSLFVGDNFGRQILYLYGNGNCGKSVVSRVLTKRLKSLNEDLCASLENFNFTDKYSTSVFTKKRLVVAPDNTDRMIIRNSIIKNITGNDNVSIRKMGKEQSSANIYAKVLVTSNYLPWVAIDKSEELTRILIVHLDTELSAKANKSWDYEKCGIWEECLYNELDDFIAKCKISYYNRLLPDGINISYYDDMPNILNHISNDNMDKIRIWWDSCLVETKRNNYLTLDELIEDYARYNGIKAFKSKWLINKNMRTFLSNITNIYKLDNIGTLGINNYKFIQTSNKRATMNKVLKDRIKELNKSDNIPEGYYE